MQGAQPIAGGFGVSSKYFFLQLPVSPHGVCFLKMVQKRVERLSRGCRGTESHGRGAGCPRRGKDIPDEKVKNHQAKQAIEEPLSTLRAFFLQQTLLRGPLLCLFQKRLHGRRGQRQGGDRQGQRPENRGTQMEDREAR